MNWGKWQEAKKLSYSMEAAGASCDFPSKVIWETFPGHPMRNRESIKGRCFISWGPVKSKFLEDPSLEPLGKKLCLHITTILGTNPSSSQRGIIFAKISEELLSTGDILLFISGIYSGWDGSGEPAPKS